MLLSLQFNRSILIPASIFGLVSVMVFGLITGSTSGSVSNLISAFVSVLVSEIRSFWAPWGFPVWLDKLYEHSYPACSQVVHGVPPKHRILAL